MPEPTWHQPIPGAAGPIYDEIRRIDALKDQLWEAAKDLRGIEVEWTGAAYDRFIEFRDGLVRQWQRAGDLHDAAAQALGSYHVTLLDTQRIAADLAERASFGQDRATAPPAWEDIRRLWAQVQEAGGAAAAAVRDCAKALREIKALPAAIPDSHSFAGSADVSDAQPATAVSLAAMINPDPRTAATDQAAYQRNLRVLAVELLLGELEVMA